MTEKSELTVDLDAVWQALSRSTQMRNALAAIAAEIEQQAAAVARIVAYDDGWYAKEFDSGSISARRARQLANARGRARQGKGYQKGALQNRQRRGQFGKHPYLDSTFVGNPDATAYDGQLGIVVNTDFKAFWVEYGSIVKGPRRVMLNAAESVAARRGGIEVEVLYDANYQANPTELGRKISAAKTARKVRRVARLLSSSGPGA